MFALVALGGGWLLRGQPGNADLPVLAGILAASLLCGAMLQGAVRLMVAPLLGATTDNLTLHAFGAWGEAWGVSAGRRVLLAIAAPAASVGAAVSLANMPPGGAAWAGFSFIPPELVGQLSAVAVLSSCVWLLLVQAVAQAVPLPHCHGRELLVGLVETATPGWNDTRRQRLLRQLLGGVACLLLGGCLLLLAIETPDRGLPRWPFLMALSAAVWATRGLRTTASPAHAASLATPGPLTVAATADPLTMPAKPTPLVASPRRRRLRPRRWISRCWGSWRVRAAQRRERSEAVDAARLDAILDRLHHDGIDSLSSEERAVLSRVSERLRQMQRDSS